MQKFHQAGQSQQFGQQQLFVDLEAVSYTHLDVYKRQVFLPGSEALTYPAVLWPGLVLAAAVPAGWAFWALAEQPAPLPPEQLLEKQKPPYLSLIHI